MESYKHSCPFCGQHIEYTVEYCGQQMLCPTCGKTVTFPALPPGRGKGVPTTRVKALDARRAAAQTKKGWLQNAPQALGFLRGFEHWDVVWQCTVPLLIIGGLLVGANFVKHKFSAAPAAPEAAPAVQADPHAWQKMADLTKADQAVQAAIREYEGAHSMLLAAQQAQQQVDKANTFAKKSADEQAQQAENNVNAAHKRLDAALQKYQDLGGTVDYRSQVHYY